MSNKSQKPTYAEQKALVMKLERTNYQKLYLIKSSNGFYKMFGHSMLIYAYDIVPKIDRLKKLPNIQTDRDIVSPCRDGWIAIRSLENIVNDLARLGIKSSSNTGGVAFVFELNKTYTKSEVKIFRQGTSNKMAKIFTAAKVKDPLPQFARTARELAELLREYERKMNDCDRSVLSEPLFRQAHEIHCGYYRIHQSNRGQKHYYEQTIKTLEQLKIDFLTNSMYDSSWIDTMLKASCLASDLDQMAKTQLRKIDTKSKNKKLYTINQERKELDNDEINTDGRRKDDCQPSLFNFSGN